MFSRKFPLSLFAATLASCTFQPAHAQEPPAAPPESAAPESATNREERPRRGEGGEGRPRREGEGGPRGEGRPRGGGEGGPRPDETPEQRQERMLAPYLEMVPDLSDSQKTHILAIMDAANIEQAAIRQNTDLSEDRVRTATRWVRGDIQNRVASALTETQLISYNEQLAERNEAAAEMAKVGSVRPDEGVDEMRERISKGYETVLEELSVKQKTAILKILEAAAEKSDAAKADDKLSATQKTDALRAIHDGVAAKVAPLLDAEQLANWKKAQAALRP